MGDLNRHERRALNKIARSGRIKTNRSRNRAVQRLFGCGPLEAREILLSAPIVPHASRLERVAREALAEATERRRAAEGAQGGAK